MQAESKYTSPAPRKVATLLAAYAKPIASATGTSMPGAPRRRSRSAPSKNGRAA